jgi:alkylation response protein AidB-like acyl-CoA dehydrogenase
MMTTSHDDGGHAAMLAQSVGDFVQRGTSLARVRKLREDPAEYDRAIWKTMAELGWLGVLVPEEHGGLGLGLAEAAIVARGLARELVPEPLTASAVLAVSALVGGDNTGLNRELLPQIVAGDVLPVLAWQERAGTLDVTAVGTRAVPAEGGWRLNGEKRFIAGAAGADGHIVSAQTADGLGLFWVPGNTAGTGLALTTLADGRHFGTLTLSDVLVPASHRVAGAGAARSALEKAVDHAAVIAGAELCGVMDRVFDMSLEYMKTRVQFGKPIGSFQALQHRAVDLYVQKQIASAVLEEALPVLDGNPDAVTRAALASRVKARCAEAGLRIAREAIQIHGAIGFTDEYDAGLYLKRAMVLSAWLGNASEHRRRYARLVPPEFE